MEKWGGKRLKSGLLRTDFLKFADIGVDSRFVLQNEVALMLVRD